MAAKVATSNVASDPGRIAANLFENSLQLFHGLLRTRAKELDRSISQRFRTQAQRFSLWGSNFDAQEGGLDERLIGAEDLNFLLLPILIKFGETLVSLAHHLNGEGDFTDLKSGLKSLVAQANDSVDAEKAAEAESSEVDGIPLSMVTIDQLSSEDSDSSGPLELSEVEEFLEDIQSYNNCLYGLGRVLQDPAERLCLETHGSGQGSKAIQEPSKMKAWPFIATVLDTYPSIDMEFARRLGEANRLRYNRLQEKRDRNTASANEVQAESSDDDPIEQVATQSHRPSSHAQSEMTAPSTQNSSKLLTFR